MLLHTFKHALQIAAAVLTESGDTERAQQILAINRHPIYALGALPSPAEQNVAVLSGDAVDTLC
ncbi:MAG: hypothetical protein ACFB13_12585 [Kiloniellaceae bacterium]